MPAHGRVGKGETRRNFGHQGGRSQSRMGTAALQPVIGSLRAHKHDRHPVAHGPNYSLEHAGWVFPSPPHTMTPASRIPGYTAPFRKRIREISWLGSHSASACSRNTHKKSSHAVAHAHNKTHVFGKPRFKAGRDGRFGFSFHPGSRRLEFLLQPREHHRVGFLALLDLSNDAGLETAKENTTPMFMFMLPKNNPKSAAAGKD